jgi:hypothetical protein
VTRLVAKELGHVITTLGEEINGRRHARTTIELDGGPATLFVLARAHRPDGPPLRVTVGQAFSGEILARDDRSMKWHELSLPAGTGQGTTEVVLASEGVALSSWSLAVDHTVSGDELSVDGGRSWSSERIGYMGVGAGRYLVRARVDSGRDPAPAPHVWEADSSAFDELLVRIPTAARDAADPWDAVRVLSTWVAKSWTYRNTSEALQYAPWDPVTILDWGERELGHAGNLPVVMCVHYAVVFAAACQALGIPARCAALTGSINGANGHFVAEVWIERWGRWVMIDPTYDVVIEGPDGPAGLRTIRELGDLRPYVRAGDGIEALLATKAGRQWFDEIFLPGVCFQNRSLWPRSDFLSGPEFSPPGHGTSSYSELELVWEERSRRNGFGMFRYFADDEWFDAPPAGFADVTASRKRTASSAGSTG